MHQILSLVSAHTTIQQMMIKLIHRNKIKTIVKTSSCLKVRQQVHSKGNKLYRYKQIQVRLKWAFYEFPPLVFLPQLIATLERNLFKNRCPLRRIFLIQANIRIQTSTTYNNSKATLSTAKIISSSSMGSNSFHQEIAIICL